MFYKVQIVQNSNFQSVANTTYWQSGTKKGNLIEKALKNPSS